MPVTFKHATLPSGLTVIAEVDPHAHSAAAGFFVRTGARDETTRLMGVSHFLEHMMFKGTDTLSADDINRTFDELGAKNNAYTSSEMTCFYAQVLPERLEPATALLATMMRPALRTSDFDTEKGVILEEIAMYKDQPFFVLYERAVEAHFGSHPLSHRILGTAESITALARDDMAAYFADRYSADNTVAAFAGNLDFDRTVDHVARLCAAWKPTAPRRNSARPRTGGGLFTVKDPKITRGYLLGMADAPAIDDPRRYAAALLTQVLGAPDNSRLHWSLIEPGIADEAQAGYEPHDGCGEYMIFASCDPDRLDEVWDVIQAQIASLLDSLTYDDLVRLRSRLATAVTLGGERPGDRMQRIGRLWTFLRAHTPLEEELARINAVTLDDLRSVAAAFPLVPTTLGRLEPPAAE